MKKTNRGARAARFLVQCFDVVCQTTAWNFHIWDWQASNAYSSKSSILHLYMKTIRAKKAEVHSTYFFTMRHKILNFATDLI